MAREAYWRSFAEIVRRLKAANKNVYVLEPFPELAVSIDRAIYRRDVLGRAAVQTTGPNAAWYERRNRAALLQLATPALSSGVTLVRSRDAVCDGSDCFAVIGGEAMYFDDNHLSLAGSRRLVRLIDHPDLLPPQPFANVKGKATAGLPDTVK